MIYKNWQWLSISWIIFKRNLGAAAAAASFGKLVSIFWSPWAKIKKVNPFFHNNTCWETCILPRICIIFKSIKNKLFVDNAMGKMEGRPITRGWQHVVAKIEGGP